MVAPSLVMTTSPLEVWIILSMPLGPSEVRTASLTALAANRLDLLTSSGLSAFLKAFCEGVPRGAAAAEAAAADMVVSAIWILRTISMLLNQTWNGWVALRVIAGEQR